MDLYDLRPYAFCLPKWGGPTGSESNRFIVIGVAERAQAEGVSMYARFV